MCLFPGPGPRAHLKLCSSTFDLIIFDISPFSSKCFAHILSNSLFDSLVGTQSQPFNLQINSSLKMSVCDYQRNAINKNVIKNVFCFLLCRPKISVKNKIVILLHIKVSVDDKTQIFFPSLKTKSFLFLQNFRQMNEVHTK